MFERLEDFRQSVTERRPFGDARPIGPVIDLEEDSSIPDDIPKEFSGSTVIEPLTLEKEE